MNSTAAKRPSTPAPLRPCAPAPLLHLILSLVAAAAASCGGTETETPPPARVEAPTEPAPVAPAPRPTQIMPAGAACITAACHARLAAAAHVHPLVRERDCSFCHEDDRGHHTFPLKRTGDDLCTDCHDVVGNLAYRHGADEVEGCTACHDPHASPARFLLTSLSVEVLCYSCHIPHEGARPHGPMAGGQCTACHLPHESDTRHLLRGGDGADHCFMCHVETKVALAQAEFVHPPAADGCTNCHDPHASDYDHALRRPVDETCFSCHEDLERHVAGAAAPHAAVFTADRCANCHDAHASNRPGLLRDRQDVLCLGCHDKPIAASTGRTIPDMTATIHDREFLHGPVRSGNCTACHAVHGASHARLLREHFTEDFYARFELDNYALCFGCHDPALVTEQRTTAVTDFRDGDLNLHFVHVNRQEKGRTCRTCHEMHGGTLPRRLAETVPFEGSGWAMPLAFRQTATGGSCAPGCHKPMAYSRGP